MKRELMRLGVSPLWIETHGYGPTRPAIDAETEEAYTRNRRVVVEVR